MIQDLLRWTADNYDKVDCEIAGAALGCMFEKKFISDNNEIEPECENNEGWDFQRRSTKETVEMKTTWGLQQGAVRINLTNKVWKNMKGQIFTSFDYLLVYENVSQRYFVISKDKIKNFDLDICVMGKNGGQKVELRWSGSYGNYDSIKVQNTLAIMDCEVTNKKYKDWYK